MTPTQLSLRLLRAEGWSADICERWVPQGAGGIRKDLFGLVDLVAVRGHETAGVQTTSHANFASRVTKITDDEHRAAFDALKAAGWLIVVHGWRLSTLKGDHACPHGKARCSCRWTLHRSVTL
jgi:hypothetical protein